MNTRYRRVIRIVVAVCTGALLGGCTGFHPVDAGPAASMAIQAQVEPGDRVRIRTIGGWEAELDVTEVGQSTLSGTPADDPSAPAVTIRYEDLSGLAVHRVDPVRTGAVVVGTGLALYTMLGLLAAAVLVPGA